MTSEQTKKQLELVQGLLGSVGGIIAAWTNIIKHIPGTKDLPDWAFLPVYALIFLFGVWMLVKWRSRHSRLLKPEALRLDRDNSEHLAGREHEIGILRGHCLIRRVVCLVGESGSGKSALVRAGLVPKLKNEKTVLPLLLGERWIDGWDMTPFVALKNALIESGAVGSDVRTKSADGLLLPGLRRLDAVADVEQELTRLNDEEGRTPLIIFDQFDDYQARNRKLFLLNKTWLEPATLRQSNPFWDMVARLLEQRKLRCLFVTRSDTAVGLSSVEFLGPDRANVSLDRVPSPDINGLLTRLTEGAPGVIADPDAGWEKLHERIIRDISEHDVILPQQLKTVLEGIKYLRWLNLKQYEGIGGVAGIEAFYVEQQINRTARTVELDTDQVRELLVELIDPQNQTKTRSCSKDELLKAALKGHGKKIAGDKLDKALEELERGEIVRSLSDQEGGRPAYRLHHDYLSRGVLGAERQANRWHYLLDDAAKAFQNAGTFWKKWNALLPFSTQCRLAWGRMRGRFRYGNHRIYALLSLINAGGVFALILLASGFSLWRALDDPYKLSYERFLAFPEEIESTTNPVDVLVLRWKFHRSAPEWNRPTLLLVANRIIEKMQSTTNADHIKTLLGAFGGIASLDGGEHTGLAATLASSILLKIRSTTDPSYLSALTRAFETTASTLEPQDARALADRISDAIRDAVNSDQRRALGLTLAAVASGLKPDEARTLGSSITEAIQGEKNVPLSLPAHEQRHTGGKPTK